MKLEQITQYWLRQLVHNSTETTITIEGYDLSGLEIDIPFKHINFKNCLMQGTIMPQGNLCGYFNLENCDLSNAKFPKTFYANNGRLCITNCTIDDNTELPELIVGGDFRVNRMDLSNFNIPSAKQGKVELYKCKFSAQTRFVSDKMEELTINDCNIDNLNMPTTLRSLTLNRCTHQVGFKMPTNFGKLLLNYCYLNNIDISSVNDQLIIGEGCQIENSFFPKMVLNSQTDSKVVLTNIYYRQ